ncbi:hypothetical protein F8M41_006326 [Gigaspora margarita]|uniref:Uncharacterized protein n=1 Tax=Gigaspora margarita TaxID=4874 RepID=A0A8H3ZZK9_GIGMA|nr:hypothetical protein F8M41_018232 [Gigaspora margarita]KAF0540707.1 hypothetical protein F8M41_006326 [Gigaspora margarita]
MSVGNFTETFTAITQDFQTRITQILNHYQNFKPKSESYLEQHKKYKNNSFSNDEDFMSDKLLEINKLFYETIAELNEEKISKFILITS